MNLAVREIAQDILPKGSRETMVTQLVRRSVIRRLMGASDCPDSPEKRLWFTVIHQSLVDAEINDDWRSKRFLLCETAWSRLILGFLGLEPEFVRNTIRTFYDWYDV